VKLRVRAGGPEATDRPFAGGLASLLTQVGARLLEAGPGGGTLAKTGARAAVYSGAIDPSAAASCASALERSIEPHLVRQRYVLPSETRAWQVMPFSQRRWSCPLRDPTSASYAAAQAVGVIELLDSDSVRRLAERLSGFELAPVPGARGLFCYGPGDYIGPHTDVGPDPEAADRIYLSFTFSDRQPAQQIFVWEGDEGLTEAADVGGGAVIQILREPTWHYTTPLVAPARASGPVRRWLAGRKFRVERRHQ
jgi:hypothetical protein